MKKNVVVFDLLFAQPIGDSKFHGGGEYIKTVFKELTNQYNGDYCLRVCFDTERYIDEWILNIISQKNIEIHSVKSAKDIVDFVQEMAKNADVRFFAGMIYPYDQFEFSDHVTCIGTCHGLRVLEKMYDTYAPLYIKGKADIKEAIKYTVFKRRMMRIHRASYENAMKRFDILLTVSEHSAHSIRVNFPEIAREKKIYVCYTPDKYVEPMEMEDRGDCTPYILMISANRWLKNSCRGVIALDGLYQKGMLQGVKTKVIGNLPETVKKKLKCKECFEFIGYVSTEDLERAYRDCEVFFYPTLNEGFGLPPMEAMKYGKTCVISGVCSLPEVYGDSVYYCNPYDIMEMQGRILNAIDKKIDACKIANRMNFIHERQKKDMEKLCELITNTSNVQ